MIKKILIANRGEIACRVSQSRRGLVVIGSIVLASCTSLPGKINLEHVGAASWAEAVNLRGLSQDKTQTVRFRRIANKVIAASELSDETWIIEVFKGTVGVFSIPKYRLGAGDLSLSNLNDREIANDIAFAVAARELELIEKRVSSAMAAQMFGGLKPSSIYGGAQKLDPVQVALSMPMSEKMREQTNERAEEIISKIDFQLDTSK